jgi:hypothetical protein
MLTKDMHRSGSTAGTLVAAVTSIVLTVVTIATGETTALEQTDWNPSRAAPSLPTGCPVRVTDTAWGGASA